MEEQIVLINWILIFFRLNIGNLSPKNMATNEELEKRIETLEKEVQHLKAVLQYQMRNKKKWFILIA